MKNLILGIFIGALLSISAYYIFFNKKEVYNPSEYDAAHALNKHKLDSMTLQLQGYMLTNDSLVKANLKLDSANTTLSTIVHSSDNEIKRLKGNINVYKNRILPDDELLKQLQIKLN